MESINLPVKPIPFPDESAASLLIRSAQANGHESVHRLFTLALDREDKFINHGDLHDQTRFNDLIKLLGFSLSHELVYPKLISTNFSDIVINDVQYPQSFFRKDGIAYCPDCIREYGYLRKIWRFIPYSVCHIHQKEIITICKKCHRETNAFRGSINYCKRCDAELPSSPSVDASKFRFLFENHIFKSQDDADRYKNLWLFIEKFTKELNTSLTRYETNEILYEMYCDHNKAANLLASSIYTKVRVKNPHDFLDWLNLQFNLPKSLIDPLLHELINREEFNDLQMYIQADISKKQAAELLRISQKKLNTYIEKEIVVWPTTKSREAKAPLDILKKANAAIHNSKAFFKPKKLSLPNEYTDFPTAGDELMINTEYVRSLCKHNWLKTEELLVDGQFRKVILKQDLIDFDAQYVLVGTLAKELELNSTNLAEKLKSIDIEPIAGPSIDGLLTTLFRRSDLEKISKEMINSIKVYKTNAGRKPNGSRTQAQNVKTSVSVPEASQLLELSQQKVATLVRKGILKRDPCEKVKIFITLESVTFLKHQINRTDLISINGACKLIGCTKQWLYINIINKEILPIYDYKYWTLMSLSDAQTMIDIRDTHFTSYEASRFLGRHRTHINNLKKRGQIIPCHAPFDTEKKLDLYSIDDINFLRLKEKFGMAAER
ncbi:TniQ family protein [Cellvibrio sp. pealriver]|uniref:TniQ family protein n=1 Tax=Cellvibrio sp. pealriver TaxID=1622269 RepID=UPI00066FC17A|nr:TniQ family protein [Cellvibrio sp. pealriver]